MRVRISDVMSGSVLPVRVSGYFSVVPGISARLTDSEFVCIAESILECLDVSGGKRTLCDNAFEGDSVVWASRRHNIAVPEELRVRFEELSNLFKIWRIILVI